MKILNLCNYAAIAVGIASIGLAHADIAQVKDGDRVRVSRDQFNSIYAPFRDIKVIADPHFSVEVSGSNVYFMPNMDKLSKIYIVNTQSSNDRIGIEIVPADMPSRDLVIESNLLTKSTLKR